MFLRRRNGESKPDPHRGLPITIPQGSDNHLTLTSVYHSLVNVLTRQNEVQEKMWAKLEAIEKRLAAFEAVDASGAKTQETK